MSLPGPVPRALLTMSRSFTRFAADRSSTRAASQARLWPRILALGIILLVLAELGARIALPDDQRPKGGYHSAEMRKQIEQYAAGPTPDLLMVGSSISSADISSAAFSQKVAQLTGKPFTAYNSGVRGCNYRCIEMAVNKYYLPVHQPANVLLVVNPSDVNSANVVVQKRSDNFISSFEKPVFLFHAENVLSDISYLYAFRGEILARLRHDEWNFDPSVVHSDGYVDMGSAPMTRYLDEPVILTSGGLTDTLINFTNSLAGRGIAVSVLSELGDSQARTLISESNMNNYNALINRLGDIDGVQVLNMPNGIPADEDYIDTLHLNSEGARAFGQFLAQEFTDQIINGDVSSTDARN